LIFSSFSAYAGTIGWFYALDEDKAAFERVSGAPVRTTTSTGGTVCYEYRVGFHRVVAAKMGSGCVTTAVTVARVLALNPVDRVISTGPAGYICNDGKPGTWFRIGEVVAWQQGSAKEGRILPSANSERKIDFEKDGWPEGVWTGFTPARIVSGEVFVASGEKRSELAREFKAELVEMNAFGLLAAVEGMNKPVLMLRVASDMADDRASEDFSAFLKTYDGAGGTMVAELVKALPVGKDEPAAHDALRGLLEE
jgi:nucleoside phosphorylase